MTAPAKVTYVSLSADDPEVRAAFDAAIADVAGQLGATHPLRIAGAARRRGADDSLQPRRHARRRRARRPAAPPPT